MKKSELIALIRPIIKDLLKEVINEGFLGEIIKETVAGVTSGVLKATMLNESPRISYTERQAPMPQYSQNAQMSVPNRPTMSAKDLNNSNVVLSDVRNQVLQNIESQNPQEQISESNYLNELRVQKENMLKTAMTIANKANLPLGILEGISMDIGKGGSMIEHSANSAPSVNANMSSLDALKLNGLNESDPGYSLNDIASIMKGGIGKVKKKHFDGGSMLS